MVGIAEIVWIEEIIERLGLELNEQQVMTGTGAGTGTGTGLEM